MTNKKGFTLVELLIVIAIIAILAGGVLVMLNPLERIQQSRDSRRVQDIQQVRQAIDLALTDGEVTLNGDGTTSAIGNSVSDGTAIAADGSTGWVKVSTVTGKVGLTKYLPVLPADPQGAAAPGSGYEWVSDGSYYEIKTSFETDNYNTDYAAADGGNEPTKYEIGTQAGLTF